MDLHLISSLSAVKYLCRQASEVWQLNIEILLIASGDFREFLNLTPNGSTTGWINRVKKRANKLKRPRRHFRRTLVHGRFIRYKLADVVKQIPRQMANGKWYWLKIQNGTKKQSKLMITKERMENIYPSKLVFSENFPSRSFTNWFSQIDWYLFYSDDKLERRPFLSQCFSNFLTVRNTCWNSIVLRASSVDQSKQQVAGGR